LVTIDTTPSEKWAKSEKNREKERRKRKNEKEKRKRANFHYRKRVLSHRNTRLKTVNAQKAGKREKAQGAR